MSYTALYRKFRPTEFADVKGQDHIITTLQNQIKANRIGHAYLFCGTREPDQGKPYRTCVSFLRNQRNRKNNGGEDICESGEL